MSSELNLTGSALIGIQGIKGPEINITQLLGKSFQYNDLVEQLETLEKLFSRTPEDEMAERLEISKKINVQKDLIEQFKKDVLQLAQAFQNIEIDTDNVETNTDRLQRAKAYFEEGEFGEARAVLETELEQMQDEQTRLLKEKERYEKNILPKLSNNSEEFYILALSTQSDYANPHRFADTCRYFELSIASEATKDNLFDYAYFLNEHTQFPKAINYYNQYLNKFANELSPEEKAATLNNLAVLHQNQNEYEKASKEYTETLEIYRNLTKDNPQAYLPDVARTLNNLAVLHWNQNEYEKASEEYTEALAIRRNLAKDNPQAYLPDVAKTLNNLAVLHWNQNEYEKASKEYEEALEIRRNLAKDNPQAYLSDVAMTLNNLAILHWNQNEYEKASKEYTEALKIYRNLAKDNPRAYLPDVAMTLNNLAILHWNQNEYEKASKEYTEALKIYRNLYEQMPNAYAPYLANTLINLAVLYQESLPEREKSFAYIAEAVILLRPIVETVPFTQEYMRKALLILRDWSLSDEEIERLIEEKMKEMEENKRVDERN
jgi:tetratricopeptide (TPR) repeat protein